MCRAMPKKPFTTRIEERLVELVGEDAQETGISINRYLEELLTSHLKLRGKLPLDWTPPRGVNWGGKRQKKQSSDRPSTNEATEGGEGDG